LANEVLGTDMKKHFSILTTFLVSHNCWLIIMLSCRYNLIALPCPALPSIAHISISCGWNIKSNPVWATYSFSVAQGVSRLVHLPLVSFCSVKTKKNQRRKSDNLFLSALLALCSEAIVQELEQTQALSNAAHWHGAVCILSLSCTRTSLHHHGHKSKQLLLQI